MDRLEKKEVVETLKKQFSDAGSIIVTHYIGMSVSETQELRSKLEQGAKFMVVKNSLAKLALKDTKYSDISDLFSGPVAVAISEDPISAAKGVVNFANDNEKLVILGGAVDENVVDISEIKALAKLPSLDELRAKIVGMISTPATRIAGVVQAPAGQIARVVNAYSQQGGDN